MSKLYNLENVLMLFAEELKRAEDKFPEWPIDVVHAAGIVNEEAGELMQAALQLTYEKKDKDCVIKEAIHVGAMALRFLINQKYLIADRSIMVNKVMLYHQYR